MMGSSPISRNPLECDDTLKNIENLKDIMQRTMDFFAGKRSEFVNSVAVRGIKRIATFLLQ